MIVVNPACLRAVESDKPASSKQTSHVHIVSIEV